VQRLILGLVQSGADEIFKNANVRLYLSVNTKIYDTTKILNLRNISLILIFIHITENLGK
jgi:hypothetical protein